MRLFCWPKARTREQPSSHGERTTSAMKKTSKARVQASGMSRRDLMKSASATAATAALMSAVKMSFPSGAFAQAAAGPEVKKAILGYIALMDASPLVIAKEKGFFARHG